MEQLLLTGSQLKAHATFASYFAGSNQAVIDYLHQVVAGTESYVYLWGETGSGSSHLLQAACHLAYQQKMSAAYLPLQQLHKLPTAVLESVEQNQLVCIDDIHVVAGNSQWEEAVFDCYNRLKEADCQFIIAGNQHPKKLGIELPDLVSRLCWGVSFQLQLLSDEEKQAALQLAANQRGFELPNSVAQFILTHCARQQGELFQLLIKLDEASLVAKCKLTIPFVKQILSL